MAEEKRNWLYAFWTKAAAFFLAAALAPVMLFYAGCAMLAYNQGWYSVSQPDFYRSDLCRSALQNALPSDLRGRDNVEALLTGDASARLELQERLGREHPAQDTFTNLRFILRDGEGQKVYSNVSAADGYCTSLYDGMVELYVAAPMQAQDAIFWTARAYSVGLGHYRRAVGLLAGFAVLELLLLVALARMAGRHSGSGAVCPGWQERLPLDLYLLIVFGLGLGMTALAAELWRWERWSDPLSLFSAFVLCAGLALLLLGSWMTLCTRIKLGKWWRNTVIFWVLQLCTRILRWLWRGLTALFRGVPLFWRTALACGLFSVLILYYARRRHWSGLLAVLAVAAIGLCWTALQLRKLQKGGQALARGDLEARMDTDYMYWDFRKHAEDLNAISRGMRIAVEQQTRSERMKAELITNVSHDIKTPLTSIINYIDLLQKDPAPEQRQEYLEILARQARRLKKLTEDLVEMSKASTGNLPCHPARRSARELVEQVLGEYEERLEKAGLAPVVTLPGEELFCMADGALTWRIMDNLLSNACKYAQAGTRLYLSVAAEGERVGFTFRNISRDPLNISAEELMERFVRGDSARTTEGSGLGLNIAQNLAELQGGALRISVDGDLFKAEVLLPRAEAPSENLKENPAEGLKIV